MALTGVDVGAMPRMATGHEVGDGADERGLGASGREGGEGGAGEAGLSWAGSRWRMGGRRRRAGLLLWAKMRERERMGL